MKYLKIVPSMKILSQDFFDLITMEKISVEKILIALQKLKFLALFTQRIFILNSESLMELCQLQTLEMKSLDLVNQVATLTSHNLLSRIWPKKD